ncbi:Calcium-dependent protein kinase [Hondaea fermentalgiana]|uniref:Calcium-dependent protein kinase n=1 Tax=Hondaea fermentalgiana TaxID=2315210 RepID=A0A2R5GMX4_9STRA|nr:Calcium-dependent protein kinase [Hondaea fermentalgiana]|eukprot:GBG31649.1 Calcium-dependent protein kinase [Hondaea fermentalgiana]
MADACGWTTDELVQAAHGSLRKTRVEGRVVTRADVENVLENLGPFVRKTLDQGRAVQIAKLGTFVPAARDPIDARGATLCLASDFLAGCGVRQRKAAKGRVQGATRLNFLALAQFAHLPKDLCRKVVDTLVWSISFALTKDKAYMRLELPGLGLFSCSRGVCDFTFGDSHELRGDVEDSSSSLFDDVGPASHSQNQSYAHSNNNHFEEDYEADHVSAADHDHDYDYDDRAERPLADGGPAHSSRAAAPVRRVVIPPSMDRLREKVKERGGANGINSLSRLLRIMDDSGDGCLSRTELKYGLQDYGIRINNAELDELFTFLDRDRSGKISFDEFLAGMRGPLSKRRLDLIHTAFGRLDRTGDGVVTLEDLEMTYDPSHDPDVQAGRTEPADALRVFLAQFDTIDQDGIVTELEFQEYYKNVSASIDDDDYFELMMRNAWHISGGKGQTANTTNRRVLVTHADGSQTIEEIKDDLWVDKNDHVEMKRRLAQANVHAQGDLGMYHASETTSAPARRAKPASLSQRHAASKPLSSTRRHEPTLAFAHGNESIPGDQALPGETARPVDESASAEDPMKKLGKLLQARRMGIDDFLLRIGANRVMGSASIDVAAFIRGLSRFDPTMSEQDAEAIARAADSDKSGSIDVAELCAYLQGASALERVKQVVTQRGGMNGIVGLTRILRNMDVSGDLALDRRELADGFAALNVKLSSKDVQDLFAYFDKDRNGKISVDEFLIGLRGDLNSRRKDLVALAFARVDRTGDGILTVQDLELSYDPSQHPDFKAGTKTKTQVLREFLDSFDGLEKDGVVTQDEFFDYYKGLSASIDDDNYFELMMRNAWHISGGTGQCANTANRRVLVTQKDGRQTVEEVHDDLYMDKHQAHAQVRARMGKEKVAEVSSYFASDATEKPRRAGPPPTASVRGAQKVAAARAQPRGGSRQGQHQKQQPKLAHRLGPSQSQSQLAWGRKPSHAREKASTPDFSQTFVGDEAMPGVAPPRSVQSRVSQSLATSTFSATSRKEPRALIDLRERVIARGGSNGIHTLGRVLRIMDDSGDKSLDRDELKYGLEDYGVKCSAAECEDLFAFLDKDKSGKISFDEFLVGLRGPLPARRRDLIGQAFAKLDRTGDGTVTVEDLEMTYDPSFHPDVRSGKLSKAQALREFLTQFDTIDQDQIVTQQEFEEYYKNVSASIDDDDYFELMMRNAWHISGGKGQTANTSNRRVLVTHEDGRQTVEEVPDDLWVDKNDHAEMKRRLAKANVRAKGALGMHYASEDTAPRSRSNQGTLSLAWDEPDDARASLAQLHARRARERKIRAGAAARVQAAARAHRAKRQVDLAKRAARSRDARARDAQAERDAQARRILRPAGPNWY